MPRLRRSNPAGPGLTRRRSGRGFRYTDAAGRRVDDPEVLGRIRALVLPPAWTDVWICADPYGHIQAVGVDAAGRRQYRYHDQWRARRDRVKHDRALDLGAALPAIRRRWRRDLRRPEIDRARVLAAVATLLDLGLFRVGGEEYAQENGSYGLATLHRDHVAVQGGAVVFDYPAKGGARRVETVTEPAVTAVVQALRRRRDRNPELFAYRVGRRWSDVRSGEINDYLREVSGLDITAKDFRTWHATVLMAAALAAHQPPPRSVTARRRVLAGAFREVSEALGNTPAVCRTAYVDPRVVDRFHDGATITPVLRRRAGGRSMQATVEQAVLDLLRE